jgi:peptidoglycan hydrolase CwlO-like protein
MRQTITAVAAIFLCCPALAGTGSDDPVSPRNAAYINILKQQRDTCVNQIANGAADDIAMIGERDGKIGELNVKLKQRDEEIAKLKKQIADVKTPDFLGVP